MSLGKEIIHFNQVVMCVPPDIPSGRAVYEGENTNNSIPVEAYVKILDPNKKHPSEELQHRLVSTVGQLDDWVAKNLDILTGGENPLYTRIFSKKEISDHQEKYSRRLKQVAEAHPHTHPVIACPMMGSWGILDWQRRNGMDENSIVPVEINGAIGVDTGSAVVRASFPPEVLNPKRYIIVADDVGDSFVSMLWVAGERMRFHQHTDPRGMVLYATRSFEGSNRNRCEYVDNRRRRRWGMGWSAVV